MEIKIDSCGRANLVEAPLPKDFRFITNSKSYPVPLSVACFLSQRVVRQIISDSSCRELQIETNNDKNQFNYIIELFEKGKIIIPNEIREDILKIAEELENTDVINQIITEWHKDIPRTNNNILEIIDFQSKHGIYNEEDINFAILCFNEIPLEQLNQARIDTIQNIINSQSLKIESESVLFKKLFDLYQKRGQEAFQLFGYIHFERLTTAEIEKFCGILSPSNITAEILERIKSRLVLDVFPGIKADPARIANTGKGVESMERYEPGEDLLNGALASLWRRFDDPSKSGIFHVYVSSTYNGTQQKMVTSPDWAGYWYSCNIQNSWLCVDLLRMRLVPSAYSLRSGKSGNSLTNWVFEASTDGINWIELDRHTEYKQLYGAFNVGLFKTETKNEFRFFRIRQTGPNKARTNNLEISRLELFGELIFLKQ